MGKPGILSAPYVASSRRIGITLFEAAGSDNGLGPFEGGMVLIAGISKAVDGPTDLLGVRGTEVSQHSLG